MEEDSKENKYIEFHLPLKGSRGARERKVQQYLKSGCPFVDIIRVEIGADGPIAVDMLMKKEHSERRRINI